jgi:predicted HD superfamily hydrolase involved in NAD metabolism
MTNFEFIHEQIKELSKKSVRNQERYLHSLRVMDMALHLNRLHQLGLNEEKIKIASLVHDYGKMMSQTKFQAYVDHYDWSQNPSIKDAIDTHHALLLPKFLKEDLGIEDEDIVDAAQFHCTGKEHMSVLTKLIMLSDYTENGRTFQNCIDVRNISYVDFEKAVYESLKRTVDCILNRNKPICNYTQKALQEYQIKYK